MGIDAPRPRGASDSPRCRVRIREKLLAELAFCLLDRSIILPRNDLPAKRFGVSVFGIPFPVSAIDIPRWKIFRMRGLLGFGILTSFCTFPRGFVSAGISVSSSTSIAIAPLSALTCIFEANARFFRRHIFESSRHPKLACGCHAPISRTGVEPRMAESNPNTAHVYIAGCFPEQSCSIMDAKSALLVKFFKIFCVAWQPRAICT